MGHLPQVWRVGGQLKDFWNFHPLKLGEDELHFDSYLTKRGWFNHQLGFCLLSVFGESKTSTFKVEPVIIIACINDSFHGQNPREKKLRCMETLPRIRNYRINYPSDVVFCPTRSLLISNLVLNESKMNFQALPSQRFLRIRVFPTDPWLLQVNHWKVLWNLMWMILWMMLLDRRWDG